MHLGRGGREDLREPSPPSGWLDVLKGWALLLNTIAVKACAFDRLEFGALM